MQSSDQNAGQWSGIAFDYERAFEPLTSRIAAEVLRMLDVRAGGRVIDIAAGTGTFSLVAADAGLSVLATDFAPGMISRLKDRIAGRDDHRIAAGVMDGQALAVPDAAFDAAVSILALMFFPDISRGLKECRRVIRPEGTAAIATWGDVRKLQLHTLLSQAIGQAVPGFRPPPVQPVWMRLVGAESLNREMKGAGFREIEITTGTFSLPVASPQAFWSDFTASAPPVVDLFRRLGPERKAAVGSVFLELLAKAGGRLAAEVCIGIGRR